MSAGNFVTVLVMVIVIWSVFTVWGEPWETKHATLVIPTRLEAAAADTEPPPLPDRMQVGSIIQRPVR